MQGQAAAVAQQTLQILTKQLIVEYGALRSLPNVRSYGILLQATAAVRRQTSAWVLDYRFHLLGVVSEHVQHSCKPFRPDAEAALSHTGVYACARDVDVSQTVGTRSSPSLCSPCWLGSSCRVSVRGPGLGQAAGTLSDRQ